MENIEKLKHMIENDLIYVEANLKLCDETTPETIKEYWNGRKSSIQIILGNLRIIER